MLNPELLRDAAALLNADIYYDPGDSRSSFMCTCYATASQRAGKGYSRASRNMGEFLVRAGFLSDPGGILFGEINEQTQSARYMLFELLALAIEDGRMEP